MTGPDVRRVGRRRLLLWAAPLAVLLLLFAGKVAVMQWSNAAGRAAYEGKDFGGAAEAFGRNGTLNLLERWVAPFNEGDALFGRQDHAGAVDRFGRALETVPHAHECTVRINLATVHEAVGDAAREAGDTDAAKTAYEQARTVLADGRCPTDAGQGAEQSAEAEEDDQRLQDKLRELGADPRPTPTPSPSPTPTSTPTPDRGTDDQQRELRSENEEGQQWRDLNDRLDNRGSTTPGYHW